MMLQRRTILGLTAGLAATAVLSACGNKDTGTGSGWSIPSTDPTATITVLSILDPVKDNMQPVIDAFQKAHPNIKLTWQTVPFDSLNSTLDSRIANKAGDPDVYWADQPRVSALASRGAAEELTSAFGQYKDAFDPTPYESGLYEDKLFALPIANSTQLLFVNKDLLDKAGLAVPDPSVDKRMTWEVITADAAKAKAGGAKYGLMFNQYDRYYQLEPLPLSLGGSVGASGKGNLTPDFGSEQWVKAFAWYNKIHADGVSPRGLKPEQTSASFLAGECAYYINGPWMLPDVGKSKLNWAVAPHPYFEGGEAKTPTGSWSLAMNPFSKNKEAAAVFIKWMTVDDGGGYIKYRSNPELAASTEGKKIYFAKDVFASEQGKNAAAIIDHETSKTAVNRVATVGYIEFETIMNQTFADIRNGADAKTSLDKATTSLKTAWQKYQ